jgi:cell filamentation protein
MQTDPYLYEGTEILKNKFNIKDSEVLNEMEAEYASLRLAQIAETPLIGVYDAEHIRKMHEFIFQDIFDWAGTYRTIDIIKHEPVLGGLSIEYAEYDKIDTALDNEIQNMKAIQWLEYSIDEQAYLFSLHLSRIWRVHPFREGNTRTITHFCCQYADSIGMNIDRSIFENNARYFRSALVAASAVFKDLGDKSKLEYLNRIVLDAMGKVA